MTLNLIEKNEILLKPAAFVGIMIVLIAIGYWFGKVI